MPEFELGPLPLTLIASILGSTILVWHRRGGPQWTLAVGGFFFILGRLMIAAICAFLLFVIIESLYRADSERQLIETAFAILISCFGAWSIVALIRVVRRDAFGPAQQEAARARYTDRHS